MEWLLATLIVALAVLIIFCVRSASDCAMHARLQARAGPDFRQLLTRPSLTRSLWAVADRVCHGCCRFSRWMWNSGQRKLRFSRQGDMLHIELQSLDMRLPEVGRHSLCSPLPLCKDRECVVLLRPSCLPHIAAMFALRRHLSVLRMKTRKLERLSIDTMELQLALPWRPAPKIGARINVLASGVHAALRYECAADGSG